MSKIKVSTIQNPSSGTDDLNIDINGNVGIGTTSPANLLHLNNDATTGTDVSYFRCEANSSNFQIKCDDMSNTNSGWAFVTGASESVRFVQGAGEALKIDSSGNVGIGSTSPAQNLDVASTNNIAYALDGWALAGKGDSSDILFGGILGSQFDTLKLYTSGSERMRIDSAGRLLVGNSSDVSGGTASTAIQISSTGGGYLGLARNDVSVVAGNGIGGLRFYANDPSAFNKVAELSCAADGTHALDDYPTRLLFSTTAVGANSPTERMRISQNGSFNCYTSSNNGFSVRTSAGAGTGAYIYQAYRSASSTTSGTIVYRVYSNGTYATISDATQKKNISTARDGYLKDLNALRVVKYHWNEQDDSEQKELGLIAQEVETVFPGLIAKFDSDSGETIKGVKSSVLTFMLIKALQEATERIETLEASNTALEQRLTDAGL